MQFARDLGKPAASRDDHQSHRFGLPWQTLAAFLRTVTHPRVAENMLCAADSWRYVADWLAAPVVWIPPATENTARVWARLREQVEVTGNLVPDELTNAIVQVRLAQIAANRLKDDDVDGALFDGFPRTEAQARALDDILASQDTKLDAVIEIDVPREKLIARLAGRRTCEACGAVYHVESDPPKVEGICDKCGGKLIQREDDKPDSIARRLALYDNQTRPLLDYYRAKGILITINGDQDIDTVTADILNALGQA